ncbi:hypothetical protein Ddye_022583 [Dipteronia dyeriana]|uniref:Reverse transcriptase zinc-binding domain-containing protein n=1 Tax=Dipteronia dyeriana TaxID=168575 RepID=A0AAD9TRC5_9ROSI|nr:hypothetical protein Ddye_022583 [Dipteronia dyeriana]
MDKILSLSTASARTDDILIWHYDKGGAYSVRSGYNVGLKLESCVSSSGTKSVARWWNMLWQPKIPPKVKKFIWKTCLNWILTTVNLYKSGMLV